MALLLPQTKSLTTIVLSNYSFKPNTSIASHKSFLQGVPSTRLLSCRALHSSFLQTLRLRVSGIPPLRHPKRALTIRATSGGDGSEEQDSSNFGLGGPGTWFGFGRKQEREVGRLAMFGFTAAIIMEVLTGKGVLGQLGIDPVAVKYPFLAGLSFLVIGGLLGGYVVIKNPPNISKAPLHEGAGVPRDPLKTYDPQNLDPLTTWTRGGIVNLPSGQKGREPYASDLDLPPPKKE